MILDNKERALYILRKYYGYSEFREGQLSIILNILNKKDVFCIMTTGAGKSLCYQIPALILEGITIVISPLISLMKDQVDSLKDSGINAAFINSTLTLEEITNIINECLIGKYKLIYIAPERLESKKFINMIKDLSISQVAIDEAHCVSQWGHDFRKSYTYIKSFVNLLKQRPIVSAFTGTATREVKEDSINLLSLINPFIFVGNINRSNLEINILKEEDKLEGIKDILKEKEDEPGIIYCLSRKEVELLYRTLKEYGFNVGMYHGGLKDEEKNKFQEDFLFERTNIIIATNAFGMGIDKSNIRYIIHCTMPKDLESYYQEIGRGGRDGARCNCYLFYNREDIRRVEFVINNSNNINRRDIALRKLQAIIDFCEENSCYISYLMKYFNNKVNYEYCSNCSNCLKNDSLKDYTKESQMILATVFRTRERYGISVLIDILKGIRGPKVVSNNLDKVTTFSIMKEYSSNFIRGLIKELLDKEEVTLKEGTYSMLKLNNNSFDILYGRKKVILIVKGDYEIANEELFKKLKLWRKERAIKENIKPYIIFSDTTLIEIVNNMPQNKEELLELRGVGNKKIEKYGKEIIKLISTYKS